MKLKASLVALFALATIPFLPSSQTPAGAQRTLTDAERTALTHRVPQGARPDLKKGIVAFGYVNTDGSKASGSANVTTSYDSGNSRYDIHIAGVSYFYSSFSTTVSYSIPIGSAECRTDSISGDLLVQCYTPSGALTQAAFGFITF